MKNIRLLFSAVVLALLISGCGKDNASNDFMPPTTINQNLTVVLSKSQIAANGTEETVITVKDNANADVTAGSTIYINNVVWGKNVFSTGTAGSYQVKATKGNLSSPVVNLIAVTSGISVFTQKTLAEFFTGTWCGICPGTLIPMEDYTKANPNTIMVGVHGPNGSGDPFEYVFDAQLRNSFGVSAVPTVIVNRDGRWDGTAASLNALASKQAPLGLAFETSVAGNSINVKAKVKFGAAIPTALKLVVMLVEDSILYNQANYGHFGLPNPIPNFPHRNILRSTATNLFGDAIPNTEQVKDRVWEKSFTINTTGYNVARSKVVGFVVYDTNAENKKGVLNVQVVKAGLDKDFD